MKIQLTIPTQQKIEGIREITLKNGNIDFEDISDNECEYILADKILNEFAHENIINCLSSLRQKLRIGGKLIIGGVDLRMFTTSVINNLISIEDASNVVNNCKSMSDSTQVANIISQLELKVISTQINGIYYEITAER